MLISHGKRLIAVPIRVVLSIMERLRMCPEFTRSIRIMEMFGNARRAYKSGNFQSAFKTFRRIAEAEKTIYGDEVFIGYAQYYLGLMYYYGTGVITDTQIAETYIRKAAEYQVEEAIEYLGNSQ